MWLADLGSRPNGDSNHSISNYLRIFLVPFSIIRIIRFIHIMSQVNALLQTLELQESAQRKGHFALFNCLVLGHTKYRGVQRVYCNPFPTKMFYGSHRMDLVMIRPPGIDNGAFVVSPESVWYARVLLLFSASAMTDTGSKSFNCALVSTLETYDDPENGNYVYYTYYINICNYVLYGTYYTSYVHYGNYAYYSYYCNYLLIAWL